MQVGLGFHCVGCPYSGDRCKGPVDLTQYFLVSSAFVGCADPMRMQAFKDVSGKYVPPNCGNQNRLNLRTRFIPQFFSRRRNEIIPVGDRIVFVALDRVIYESGTVRYHLKDDLLKVLGLPTGTRIGLVGTCRDHVLEQFWTKADREDSWTKLVSLGFEFVTSLTCSVYDGWPLFSQKFNQDRNFLSHDIFSSFGIPTVPFVMPNSNLDIDYVVKWIRKRPGITHVAVHASGFTRRPSEFDNLVTWVRRIELELDRPLRFLMVGVARPDQMKKLLIEFDAIILNPRPVMEALRTGNQYDSNLVSCEAIDNSRDSLILPNIIAFENYCNSYGGNEDFGISP